jgi:hypothetical protein
MGSDPNELAVKLLMPPCRTSISGLPTRAGPSLAMMREINCWTDLYFLCERKSPDWNSFLGSEDRFNFQGISRFWIMHSPATKTCVRSDDFQNAGAQSAILHPIVFVWNKLIQLSFVKKPLSLDCGVTNHGISCRVLVITSSETLQRSLPQFHYFSSICCLFLWWHTPQPLQSNVGLCVHKLKALEILTIWILALGPSSVCACPWSHWCCVYLLLAGIQEIRKNWPSIRHAGPKWPCFGTLFYYHGCLDHLLLMRLISPCALEHWTLTENILLGSLLP